MSDKKVMGAMSPQREWIRENMKPKTSPKTLEMQATKQVSSQAFVVWDSSQGEYRNGENRRKYNMERLAQKKADARKKRLDKRLSS